jgi:hypothetical protein
LGVKNPLQRVNGHAENCITQILFYINRINLAVPNFGSPLLGVDFTLLTSGVVGFGVTGFNGFTITYHAKSLTVLDLI